MSLLKQLAFATIVATSVVACTANDEPANQRGTGATPGATGTAGAADNVDREFLQNITAANQREIALGQLALQKATNPSVREFAEMMVRDHQQAGDELRQVLSKHTIQLPVSTDDTNDARERLADLTGAEFDREFMNTMVDEHEKAVEMVRDEAEDNDTHADIRQWASKTLPTLQQHLDRAKQLDEMLERQK
jgi:putative membrane protein